LVGTKTAVARSAVWRIFGTTPKAPPALLAPPKASEEPEGTETRAEKAARRESAPFSLLPFFTGEGVGEADG
jgi:hypothetical protein